MPAAAAPRPAPPALFALTVFTSAALVFMVQPMVAKLVLPLLGGSSSVWNTSMAFFQLALLAGYFYAHLLQRIPTVRGQALTHLAALIVAAVALPLRVNGLAGPPSSEHPNLWLLAVLTLSIGAPFAVLSATAPLVQAWHARTVGAAGGKEPYVLYAASNLGSLLALLAYPIAVEPAFTLFGQRMGWSLGYVLFVLVIGALALAVSRARAEAAERAAPAATPSPSWRQRLIWVALAAIPSSLMLGVTTYITTDIASAPFLWVLPLALYLNWRLAILLFILCVVFTAMTTLVVRKTYKMQDAVEEHYSSFAERATDALGNVALVQSFVRVESEVKDIRGVADKLLAAQLPVLSWWAVVGISTRAATTLTIRRYALFFFAIIAILSYASEVTADRTDTRASWRSFFGVLKRSETYVPNIGGPVKMLAHGTTLHGAQAQADAYRCRPMVYYTPRTPIGQVFTTKSAERADLRIGAVGLGTGSVAAYTRPGDHLTFFEIDPLVVKVSTDPKNFTYTTECAKGRVDYVIGDARLTVAKQPDATFDILLIDAFSSDSVPAHLLTVEAVKGYLKKLKPDGILILHLSNRNLDLLGPAQAVARASGGQGLIQNYRPGKDPEGSWESAEDAVIVARDREALEAYVRSGKWRTVDPFLTRPWTDDYTNLAGSLYANLKGRWTWLP